MLIQLTVGKVDAGVAVLLTQDKRLIEFPSILLPASITCGSIVDITVSPNEAAEEKSRAAFSDLQSRILTKFGLTSPSPPTLRLRGATQTSLVLEWDALQLATANLKSLSLYRNGSKAGRIPRPMEMMSTKISGLAVDTEYSFSLLLRTTAGTYSSPTLTCRTHKMTELSGITVTPGTLPEPLRASLETAVRRIGAKITPTVQIDTTHLICTEGTGKEWERAVEMNVPVVRPEWIDGCEREGRIVAVTAYYLDANPKHRKVGSNPSISASQPSSSAAVAPANAGPSGSQTNLPQRSGGPPTRESSTRAAQEPPNPPPPASKPPPQAPNSTSTAPSGPQDHPTPNTTTPSRPSVSSATDSSPAGDGDTGDTEADISDPDGSPGPEQESHPAGPGNGARSEASLKAKVEEDGDEDGNEDEDEDDAEDKNTNATAAHGNRAQMENVPL